MSGLSGLIDALLAARLAPRLDVLGIKAEAAIGAPGPVISVEKTRNDVRLPSNAALDRLIPGVGSAVPHPAGGAASSPGAQLSVAARVISAVLADLQAEPGPVRGSAPAWPSPQAASSAALAGNLAQTVADSGLFYESHLAQLATGIRTLAQLSQEPQARWSTLSTAPSTQGTQQAGPAAQAAQAMPGASVPPGLAEVFSPVALKETLPLIVAQSASPLPTENASAEALPAATSPGARGLSAGANEGGAAGAPGAAVPAADPDTRMDSTRLQAAYRWAEGAAGASDSAPAHRAEDVARHSSAVSASAAHSNAAAIEVIHPQAVTLVHQQLDLLATSVFRWSGQAWPGVPMNWSIEEEPQDPSAGAPDEETPRRWSTMLSLSLPRLGAVDLRLSLTGPVVQAHLAASETSTVSRLRADGGTLSSRLEAAGLRLQELQVTERAGA